jgi:hypothetical protein
MTYQLTYSNNCLDNYYEYYNKGEVRAIKLDGIIIARQLRNQNLGPEGC